MPWRLVGMLCVLVMIWHFGVDICVSCVFLIGNTIYLLLLFSF